MSKVSICVTTYNRASTLSLTLDSILQQSFSDFELIISDDNSTDGTQSICRAYCEKDNRVLYFRNPRNLKMPGNLNAAISKASGEYIANLHDGDIYRNDLIEKWYSLLEKYPDALFVFNQYTALDEKGNIQTIYNHQLKEINDGEVLVKYFLKTFTSAPWGTVMARRTAYEKFGMFDERYGFISDVEMWLRLGLNGKVCYVNEPLIDLTPREREHPYFLPHWRMFCINTRIVLEYYVLYKEKNKDLEKQFPVGGLIKKIEETAIHQTFILLRHRDFYRIREGLFVFRRLPIQGLKKIVRFLFFLRPVTPPYLTDISILCNIINNINHIGSNSSK